MKNRKRIPLPGQRIIRSAIAVALCLLIDVLRGHRGIPLYSAIAALQCMADAPRPNAITEPYSAEGVYTDSVNNTESYAYHVPQLTADSAAAKEINAEIRERFGSVVESQFSDMEGGYSLWSWHVVWHPYWHGDQLFLLITADTQGGFVDHAAYGYDFAADKRITNEMILTELGITEDAYISNLKEKVQLMFEDMYKDVPADMREQAGMDTMLQKTPSWADMNQPMFIDGVGTAETIVKIASIAGADWYYHLATPFAYG